MKQGEGAERLAEQLYLEKVFWNVEMPYRDRCRFLQLTEQRERSFQDWQSSFLELLPKEKAGKIRREVWPEEEGERLFRQGIKVAVPGDSDWPLALSKMADPPLWVWYRGKAPSSFDERVPLALVGSRKAGAYARKAAYELTALAVRRGHAVISGLARGLDGWAHRCTLDFGGRTAAVLPCGLNRCYPPEHQSLLEEILEQGFALSEFPPDYPLLRTNFHSRNRLISALSAAVIILQGAERSGSLITARFAAEQGKELWVLPGSLYAPEFRGSNRLISEGAGILYDYQQLRTLPLPMGGKEFPETDSAAAKPSAAMKKLAKGSTEAPLSRPSEAHSASAAVHGKKGRRLSDDEKRLLKTMGSSEWETEELARLLGLDWKTLRIRFARLELDGFVCHRFDRFILTELGLSCIYNH